MIFPADSDSGCDCSSGSLVQYERLVESLCFPDGFRSLVLYCARIVDVVHFIRDGGLSDNENNNEQTCSFVKI